MFSVFLLNFSNLKERGAEDGWLFAGGLRSKPRTKASVDSSAAKMVRLAYFI